MKREPIRTRKAFTLIELLVVVAIIAMLISILLPALGEAREQAKVAVCLANQDQLLTAATMYLMDWNDNLPFAAFDSARGTSVCSWQYGGKTNHPDWEGQSSYIEVQDRPLNSYIMGTDLGPDLRDESGEILERTEVPVLRCPSDRYSNQWRFGTTTGQRRGRSSYEDVGTSYHYNMHALQDLDWASPESMDDWLWNRNGWAKLNHRLLKSVFRKQVSTFVMFMEDPMDWSFNDNTQEIGNHRKFSKHTVGFPDAHAAYIHADTRGWCGPGWEAINIDWIWNFGDMGMWYADSYKDCDPVIED